jgi:hypothetical protein
MEENGFSAEDYNVCNNSCNSFTEQLSRRIELGARFPSAVSSQSRIGEMLSPVARVLDLVPESRSPSPSSSFVSGAKKKQKKKRLSISSVSSGASLSDSRVAPAVGALERQVEDVGRG